MIPEISRPGQASRTIRETILVVHVVRGSRLRSQLQRRDEPIVPFDRVNLRFPSPLKKARIIRIVANNLFVEATRCISTRSTCLGSLSP